MPNRKGDTIREHEAIMRAILAHDAEGAHRAMREHVALLGDNLLDFLAPSTERPGVWYAYCWLVHTEHRTRSQPCASTSAVKPFSSPAPSKGIGLAVAQVFAAEGCHLHLAARNGAAMEEAKRSLEAEHGVRVTVHALDLSSTEAMETARRHGGRHRHPHQ